MREDQYIQGTGPTPQTCVRSCRSYGPPRLAGPRPYRSSREDVDNPAGVDCLPSTWVRVKKSRNPESRLVGSRRHPIISFSHGISQPLPKRPLRVLTTLPSSFASEYLGRFSSRFTMTNRSLPTARCSTIWSRVAEPASNCN